MRVAAWKVWYADGSRHVGTTPEAWAELPADGVLVVMLYYDEHAETPPHVRLRRIMQGNDSYWLQPGEPDHIYGQSNDPPGAIRERYPGAMVKLGRWADDGTYKEVEQAAMADREEDW